MKFNFSDLHELNHVNDATATLLLQLQNRNIEKLFNINKGKNRENEYSDADLVMIIYQKKLEERKTIIVDRRMSRSLTQVVISDVALLTESVAEENVAVRDRALTYCLNGTSVSLVTTE